MLQKRAPIAACSIFYLIGIIIGYHFGFFLLFDFLLFISILLLALLYYLYLYKENEAYHISLKTSFFITFTLLGATAIGYHHRSDTDNNSILASITERVVAVKVVEITNNRISSHIVGNNEKIILFITNNDKKEIECGDTLVLKIKPKKFKYPNKKGYNYFSSTDLNSVSLIKAKEISIKEQIGRYRSKYKTLIDFLIPSKRAAALLSALTIGDKSGIDTNTKAAFSASGASHILAVSGLHVGYLYAFIVGALSILGNSRISRGVKSTMIISALWSYAFLTGFSPSIVRAVTMATIFEISKLMQRGSFSLNSLFASALIITIIDPEALFDIGFQLSYSAVLSIIMINPLLCKIYIPDNKIIKHFWMIITISLSCQIGTAPIIVYYFHTLPVYFLVTNILILPLTAIILYLAIAMLLSIKIPFMLKLLAPSLRWLLDLMITIIDSIHTLPYSSIHF